jgi:hypothetical protein
LGECRFFFRGVVVFPGRVPGGVAVEILSASLFVACDLGSSAGFANFPDQTELGNRSGGRRDDIDDRYVEQSRPVDSESGAELARVVPGGDGTEAELAVQEVVKWRLN